MLSVPIETVASKGCCVASVGMTNGQMQCHYAVAAGGVGECVCRGNVRRLGKMFSVPIELVASKGCRVAGVAVTEGEMESDD